MEPTGNKELAAVVLGFLCLGLLLLGGFALYRLALPMILESTMAGSGYLAAVVGVFGTVGLFVAACAMFGRVVRLFNS